MDDVSVEFVKDLVVTQRKTHSEVSLLLKEAYPDRRGLSLRSVRRFCLKEKVTPKIVFFLSSPIKSLYGVKLITEVLASKVYAIPRN